MKTIKDILLAVLLTFIAASCKEADEFSDVVFMTGTESSSITRLTIDGPATMGISATSSSKVVTDVKVSFAVDNTLVATYNGENGSNYKALPEGSFRLSSSESVIKAGSNVSDPVMFHLDSTEELEDGIVYLVPIALTNVEGMSLLQSGKTQYIIINRTIVTSALSLANTRFYVPNFQKDASLKSLPKLSMECRVKVNAFTTWDPYISTVMGIEFGENFLLRFGDVTIKNNQLQLTAKDQLTTPMAFETGKWYHIAAVFDGSTLSLYVDGALQVTKQATRGAVNLFDGGDFNFGYSYNGRYLNGYISEARVWTKALTQAEIEGNVCYVAPDTGGLLAYWRFNEGQGSKSVDFTGHGYDAVNHNGKDANWVEGVRCPE